MSVRQVTGTLLRGVGVCEEAVENVRLLVSEIVTNAVVHGTGGLVGFTLSYRPGADVLIEVDDDHSPGQVTVRRPGPEDESGRGMLLVAALARRSGRRGSRTWCTVATSAVSSP